MSREGHRRYAVYFLPQQGSDLARFGARWLGWDVDRGVAMPSAAPDLTETPRKYGFHGTLKAPFRLADGTELAGLTRAATDLAARQSPVMLEGLQVSRLGAFLALTPVGDVAALNTLAASCVRELDVFRAPPTEAELVRRRKKGLHPAQEKLLLTWGYPYVMEQFRFHMTLTGRIPTAQQAEVQARLVDVLPTLPAPFEIAEIALVGERSDGAFETICRMALGAQPT